MPTVPARADVPIESTWNHESVFPSFDAWREEYRAADRKTEPFSGTNVHNPPALVKYAAAGVQQMSNRA